MKKWKCNRFLPIENIKRGLPVYITFMLLMTALAVTGSFLTGCAASQGEIDTATHGDGAEESLRVISTIFAPYDFAREIAGEKASITMLLPPASESHTFEPSPRQIIDIQNCDVFIYVGGESDEWVRTILSSMSTPNMKVVTLMDCVETVKEEMTEGMEISSGNRYDEIDTAHDHEETEAEHVHDETDTTHDHDETDTEHNHSDTTNDHHYHSNAADYDEHVWTSPRNAALIVEAITQALCEADPVNVEVYQTNADAYQQQLRALDTAFREVTEQALRKTIVFGDRFPFRYLTDAYELNYFAAFPGCAAETEPSAETVAFLINKIREENIPVVFYTEMSNQKMANVLCGETDAKPLLLHACHNISQEDFTSGVTYLALMTRNVTALREALH